MMLASALVLGLSGMAMANAGAGGAEPDVVLHELEAGNLRFTSNAMLHPNQDSARREEVFVHGTTAVLGLPSCF
ncbi:MAG: hypothetical protein HYS21_02220 [Deltaproteobacteria bacterium]|nr:hypothetical protein [Deltaproteobacteria bacterium]